MRPVKLFVVLWCEQCQKHTMQDAYLLPHIQLHPQIEWHYHYVGGCLDCGTTNFQTIVRKLPDEKNTL